MYAWIQRSNNFLHVSVYAKITIAVYLYIFFASLRLCVKSL